MVARWWRVPALACGLVVAAAGTVEAAPTTAPSAVSLSLSTVRPARHGPVTATLTGCDPGTTVRFWHWATYRVDPGVPDEEDLELYEITNATCGADARAAATFVAGPPQWEDPTRTITGGAVEVTFGEGPDDAVVARATFEIAGSADELPATGRTGALATVAALTLGAGLALVLAARRRPT